MLGQIPEKKKTQLVGQNSGLSGESWPEIGSRFRRTRQGEYKKNRVVRPKP